MPLFSALRTMLFTLSPREVSFARRGFTALPEIREHLERAGSGFVSGYNAAMRHDSLARLCSELDALPDDLHGFAYEGSAMALALLDILTPWASSRWRALVNAVGDRHVYLCFVGAGWAVARLRLRQLPRFVREADALLPPLAFDGYGFHEAFFHPARTVRQAAVPPLRGAAARAFDQGVGRSLWFVDGADPERIAATIGAFPPPRQEDLWSGTGLALGYAGGVPADAIDACMRASGRHVAALAQGVAFAAAARVRARRTTFSTELACRRIWRRTPAEVATLVDEALAASDRSPAEPYEAWRFQIRRRFLNGSPDFVISVRP